MKLWKIDIANKKIHKLYDTETLSDGQEQDGFVCRAIPEGFEPGNVVLVDDGLEQGAASLTLAGDNDAKSSPLWDDMRAQRNQLLAATDWTQAADVQASENILSAQEKTDYATYRQALRDLPANTSNPEDVSWPEVGA